MTTFDQKGLRVFHIHLGEAGGAENFFVRLVEGLSERGVEQLALTRPNRVWHGAIKPHCQLETSRFSSSHIKKFIERRRIHKMTRSFRPDVIMAWMATATRWVPKGPRGSASLVRLGDFPDKIEPLNSCEHIVGNTPEIIRRCIALGWPQEKGHVICNFVDPVYVEPMSRAQMGVAKDSYLIVALGRFVERKGFAYLFDALIDLPNVSLCLLGDGPLKAEFNDFVVQHGLNHRVVMPGWIADPRPYIRAADCLCCPSLVEPLGNVVLEGWACGVPVVATNSEGPGWLIKDGETGLLCEKSDAAALASAIRRLQSHSNTRRIVSAASGVLTERYSRARIVCDYLKLFDQITRDK